MPYAGSGPRFLTDIVYVTALPAAVVGEETAIVRTRSAERGAARVTEAWSLAGFGSSGPAAPTLAETTTGSLVPTVAVR